MGVNRRQVLAGAAWSAPAVAVATALPAFAASGGTGPAPASSALTAVYVEVNHEDLATVGTFVLEGSRRPVFDLAMIFAANINFDGTAAYLHLNDRVTATLDDADTQIRPLQAKGTKVLLSVLGNNQGAGFANFPTEQDADRFAAKVAKVVHEYHLDGVDLDDEYSEYGTNGTGNPNEDSFVWLVHALRRHLAPHELITFYAIGPSAERTVSGSGKASDALDYAWNPWYGSYSAPSVPGMAKEHLGAAAVDWGRTSPSTVQSMASRTVEDGYGVFMSYDLRDTTDLSSVQAMTLVLREERAVRS